MSATIASGSMNQALTLDEWNGGLPADCHALLAFTNDESNLFLSDDSVTFWLVISALTNDSPGHKIVLGATPLIVQEGGEGVTPPASSSIPPITPPRKATRVMPSPLTSPASTTRSPRSTQR